MMQSQLSGSVPDWLRQRAQLTPDRQALIDNTTQLTYGALDQTVDCAAQRLLDAGVSDGGRVGLLAGNSIGFAIAVHTVTRIGAVLVPLNPRLAPPELAWQVEDAGIAHLIVDADRSALAKRLRLRCMSLEELTTPGAATTQIEHRFELAAVQTIVYTSGTTGRPKGAQLTYGNHLWSALASAINLGARDDDRWLACLPLYHVGGHAILLRSVIYGTCAVIHESFDAARVNHAIDNGGVTHVSLVTNMLQRVLEARGEAPFPDTLRCVLLGGGPAPLPLLEECAARHVPVVQTYGLTETASQIATLPPEDALRKLGSAGKPLFGSELRIVDDAGAECAPGNAGEIVVRGPTVTPGYINDVASPLRGGWLHTGDAGYMDDEGYLYVLDRRDDLIVSGGENVHPAEVEAALQAHPGVVEAGVFGGPDAQWGSVPIAVVVLRKDANARPDDLIAFCRERLAGYKTPKRIEFVDVLPRNAAGKLLRNELRSRFG